MSEAYLVRGRLSRGNVGESGVNLRRRTRDVKRTVDENGDDLTRVRVHGAALGLLVQVLSGTESTNGELAALERDHLHALAVDVAVADDDTTGLGNDAGDGADLGDLTNLHDDS